MTQSRRTYLNIESKEYFNFGRSTTCLLTVKLKISSISNSIMDSRYSIYVANVLLALAKKYLRDEHYFSYVAHGCIYFHVNSTVRCSDSDIFSIEEGNKQAYIKAKRRALYVASKITNYAITGLQELLGKIVSANNAIHYKYSKYDKFKNN